ncbi:MAG: GNAT family N-acetyltransferase, partial [candidate division NC10 bacterium]
DPDVTRYLGDGRLWAVEERDGGRLIGRIGCHYPEGWPGFEVGWALARQYWGRGYAFEGARAALNHAFTALAQDRVISLIHPANERSIRLAERLGERAEGTTEVHTGGALPPSKRKERSLSTPQSATSARSEVRQVAPKLIELSEKVLYGDVWERPGLSKRDRSLITVAALTVMGRSDQLPGHLERALANGVTREEIGELITHLAFYAGWPAAMTAGRIARKVFDERKP